MAQTEEVCDKGIAEWVVLMSDASSPAATAMNKIVCLNSSTTCAASKTSAYGTPTVTHHAASGLEVTAIDTMGTATTNTAGDTVTFDHVFTATGTLNVASINACNDDEDVTFVECCFASIIAMENTDTLTIDGAVVVDQA